MASANQHSQTFQFVSRVTSLPIINTTLSTVHSVYDNTKQRYQIVGAAANTVESSAKFVLGKVQAVAQDSTILKQLPLASVDALACKGLDGIEALLPVIKQEPSVIYETTTKLPGVIYENTTKLPSTIYNKAHQVVDTNVVSPIAKTKANIESFSAKAVDNALSFSEHLAEKVLPVEHANGNEANEGPAPTTTRIVNLASNIKKGTVKRFQDVKAQGIKLREPEERTKLSQQAISLVSYAKDVAAGYGARAFKTLEVVADSAVQAAEAHPISAPYVAKGKKVVSSTQSFVTARVQQVKDTKSAAVNLVTGTATTAKNVVVSTATFAYTSVTSVVSYATSTVTATRARVNAAKDDAVKTAIGAPVAAYNVYASYAPKSLVTLTDAAYDNVAQRFTGKLAQPIPEQDLVAKAVKFVGAPKEVYVVVDTARDVAVDVLFGVASRVGADGLLKKFLPFSPSSVPAASAVLVQ